MKKTSTLNYAFSVGKIRALEGFLIKEEIFQEAIDLELPEALRLFVESGLYSDELLGVSDSQQLEVALTKEQLKLKELASNLILDKELLGLLELKDLNQLDNILKNYGSAFLRDYFQHLVDLHNIKTFLRLYILKEPLGNLEITLLSGGLIDKTDFSKFYQEDIAFFLHRLEYVHKDSRIINYAAYLREAIEKLEKEKSFVTLEKAINDFLIQVLKQAKYFTFGPEPVLAYYFAKLNEINLIRMIILAKINNVSGDLLKERLNTTYA